MTVSPIASPYPSKLTFSGASRLLAMESPLRMVYRVFKKATVRQNADGFSSWLSLKYPMKRIIRAKLARLYFELAVLPGMDPRLIEVASNTCMTLVANKKRIDINDLQLPWEPLYAVLERELFPKKRKTGITNISITLLTLTEYCQRFFPPHEVPKMLETFLPRLDGSSLNSILATQSFMAHFLPLSHPEDWIQPVFVLWEAFSNSQIYTEQWLDVMSRLAEKHMDPSISEPKLIDRYRKFFERNALVTQADDVSTSTEDAKSPSAEPSASSLHANGDDHLEMATEATASPPLVSSGLPRLRKLATTNDKWKGIRKEVGIFTLEQWDFLMQRTLRAMGIPVGNVRKANANFISQGGEMGAVNADAAANATVMKMKKPSEKLHSLAILLVYSMSPDSPVLDKTPEHSNLPSRSASAANLSTLRDSISASSSFSHTVVNEVKAFVGGSRAIDSLIKFINATESFFHPSNYGHWTGALARFLQNVTWEFAKRWTEEEKADCKTPQEWRLTPRIKKEFVLATRQVAFLAMFSKDPMAMGCAQSALKSMSFLEPG